jgi:CheY-like chemotaxis protein
MVSSGLPVHGILTAEAPSVQSSRTTHTVVLIVDDYQDCRDMYAAYLALAGFQVLKARDGFEALAIVDRELPDVILMDIGLPGMDGIETTRRLKADPATNGVPVVAFTAHPRPEGDAAACFDGVLIKPCLPDELADHLHAVVASRARRDRG